ncbi:MAG: DUF364 domain-containing protein [Fibrobacterota bacterium]
MISLIPDDLIVDDALIGLHWTLVRSAGVGISMTQPGGPRSIPGAGGFRGRRLKELAALVKSWHPHEAALGLAAINAYMNAPSTLEKHWKIGPETQPNQSVFLYMKPELAEKRVTVVGHFPDLNELEPVCRLSILERQPMEGDFPDPACEYILEDQDYLFITGVTIINKTLPRLIELGRHARIVMVGPSVPLAPFWFSRGISSLAGTTVTDADKVWRHVAEGGDRSIFKHGAHMFKLSKADAR